MQVKNQEQNFNEKDNNLLTKLLKKINSLVKNRDKNYKKISKLNDEINFGDRINEYDESLRKLQREYKNYKSFDTIKQEKQAVKELRKKNKKDEATKIKLLKKQEKLKIKELKKQEADKIKLLKKQDKLKIKELKKQEADKIKLLKKKETERIKKIKKDTEIKQVKKDVSEAIEEYKNKQNDNKPVDINKLRNEGIRRILVKIENFLINGTAAIVNVQEDILNYGLTTKDFLNIVKNNINSYDRGVLEIMEQNFEKLYRVLNDDNLYKLSNFSNENIKSVIAQSTFSDAQFIEYYYNAIRYTITKIKDAATYYKFKGKFLCYTNNTDINMDRYGLYKELTDDKLEIINKNNCLYIALETLKMSTYKLQKFKSIIKTRHISICKLKELTELLNITIELYKFKNDDSNEHLKTTYGNNDLEIYKVAFYKNHYFIYDDINYSSYSLNNYFTLKGIKDFNKIYSTNSKGSYNKDEKRAFTNSLTALKIFLENKLMKPMDNNTINIFNTLFYDELNTTADDNEIFINEKEFLYADKRQEKGLTKDDEEEEEYNDFKDYKIATFDFETYTNDKNEIIPYLGVLKYDGEKEKRAYGVNCAKDLMKFINTNTFLIGHNAKFDYSFICEHLYNKQELFNGSKFISCKATYNKHNLKIVDFYNLISEPLKNMNDIFKLGDTHKEYMPYDLFNDNSIDILKCQYVNYDKCLSFVKSDEDKELFLENCEKWRCFTNDNKMINMVKYSMEYCVIDCEVLQKSYNTFKNWISEAFNINIDNCLTTSSISRKLLQKRRVFIDCYKHSGAIQQYIKNFIVGGRTMCANNEKHKILDKIITALDANSLYPSAIIKTGFIKGTPKKINKNTKYNEIKDYTHYFIRIKINKVGIKLKFPLLSRKDDKGILNFTNDLCGDKIHYVDKTTLEDLIKYQKIEFDIIDGIYYNDGRNYAICDLVNELYEIRKLKVKEENPIELVYKLVLNSIYGIMIENEHMSKILNFNNENDFNKYLDLNHESISEYVKINNSYRVYVKSEISNHFNCSHIGVDILSYSKHIMNDVICLSEQLNKDVYYQDTDSLFINLDDVNEINEKYIKDTGKILLGNELGQFKTDLKIKGCENVKGSNAYFLGKKCYYLKMTGTDKKTKDIIIKDKIRMAGVSDTSIMYEINKQVVNKKGDIVNQFIDCEEVYKKLFDGEAVEFDLCEYNETTNKPGKFKVEYNKLTLGMTQRTEFKRTRQFN